MSKNLEELRRTIDTLDDRIHDTLMERAKLIVGIAEEKRKAGLQYVQPAREAMMIRRLLARHKGALPPQAVVRIWRELVGAVSLMQTGLKVSVSMDKANVALWEMAKDYFGSVVPMIKSTTSLAAVASVREGESSFAVVPWPRDGEDKSWWPFLFGQQEKEKMRIVCALPYGSLEGNIVSSEDKALVVSRVDFLSSENDHSFIGLDADQSVSRARVVDVLKKLDIEALSILTKTSKANSLHMIEVSDFIAEGDPRLQAIAQKFEGLDVRCIALGGYPVPPVYKKPKIVSSAKPEKKKIAAQE